MDMMERGEEEEEVHGRSFHVSVSKKDFEERNIDINKEMSRFDALVMVASIVAEKEEKEMQMRMQRTMMKENSLAHRLKFQSASEKRKSPVPLSSTERMELHGFHKADALALGWAVRQPLTAPVDGWKKRTYPHTEMAEDDEGAAQGPKRGRMERTKISCGDGKKGRVSKAKQPPLPDPKLATLPQEFKSKIADLAATSFLDINPILLIQKRLTSSDLDRGQARLSMPVRQLEDPKFLRDAEKEMLGKNKPGFEVTIIQPNLEVSLAKFQLWPTGKTSSQYVFKSVWNKAPHGNRLQVDDLIRIWHFRKNEGLCFAIVKVDEGRQYPEGQQHPEGEEESEEQGEAQV